jgi:hypothetical protein
MDLVVKTVMYLIGLESAFPFVDLCHHVAGQEWKLAPGSCDLERGDIGNIISVWPM